MADADFPGTYVLWLVELVESRGLSCDGILAEVGLVRARLSAPDERVPMSAVKRLAARARALTGDPTMAIEIGMRMHVAAHGFLGFAAMTSSTVGEALELAERFIATRTAALSLATRRRGAEATIQLDANVPLGEFLPEVVIALFTGLWRMGTDLTGKPLAGRVELAFGRRPGYESLEQVAPGPVRYDQPANRLCFRAEVLDLPLVTADPAATQLAREQCERELAELRTGGAARLVARVRGAILAGGRVRGVEDVARELGLSTRSLKRRLAEHGTSFRALRDQARLDRAERLLAEEERSIEQIAEALDYSDVASFTRAYRRWTGTTPAAARRARLGGDDP